MALLLSDGGNAEDWDFSAEMRDLRDAEISGTILDFRQHGSGNAQDIEQLLIPFVRADIIHQRPRGIGGVGDEAPAASQTPDQECIDGAEAKLALGGAGTRALHVGEQPGQFGAGKIGIEQQAGTADKELFQVLTLQFLTIACRAGRTPRLRRWSGR